MMMETGSNEVDEWVYSALSKVQVAPLSALILPARVPEFKATALVSRTSPLEFIGLPLKFF